MPVVIPDSIDPSLVTDPSLFVDASLLADPSSFPDASPLVEPSLSGDPPSEGGLLDEPHAAVNASDATAAPRRDTLIPALRSPAWTAPS
jgi:hypothetical protein